MKMEVEMKKELFVIFFLLFGKLCAQANIKDIPVPEGASERQIDLTAEDPILLISLEELIKKAQKEKKEYRIAEVVTKSPGSERIFYHYFDSGSLDELFRSSPGTPKNPLNRLPIRDVYFYYIGSLDDELRSAPEEHKHFEVAAAPVVAPAIPIATPIHIGRRQDGSIEIIAMNQVVDLDVLKQQLLAHTLSPCQERPCDVILENCQISEIPEAFFTDLPNIRELNLRRNQIETLPETIGNLGSLRILYLDRNHLTALPEAIGNLRDLQELSLGRNQIETLPETIGRLRNLKKLTMPANLLTTLPKEIGNLRNLEGLYLAENRLTILPKTIGKLRRLRMLFLDRNQLTTLPKEIGNLNNLRALGVDPDIIANNREIVDTLRARGATVLD